MTVPSRADYHYMQHALELARRGLGRTAPNPSVGCVLVKDGIIVGRGNTQPGGRPHAERVALDMAGTQAAGATAYVSLEPCSHTGKTGPCADALIAAGVARVVVGAGDPDPRVSGRGLAALRTAGIEVMDHVARPAAERLNWGFFLRATVGRPFFNLKMASTIDGRIALASGESKWITGPDARQFGHMLRANHDAILVGVNTVLTDDPGLDCRLPGLAERSPIRIILDSSLRTPIDSLLVTTAGEVPTWIVTSTTMTTRAEAYRDWGVEVIEMENPYDLKAVAKALGARGVTRVLVEGGGQVHASFLKAGLADAVHHFTAAKFIGADGLPEIGTLGLACLGDAPHLTLRTIRHLGPDLLASYEKAE